MIGSYLLREGEELQCRGQFEQAIAAFQRCFEADANAQALRRIGECYLALSRPSDAILYLAASLGLKANPRVAFDLGKTLFACGHVDAARDATQQALSTTADYRRAVELLEQIEGASSAAHEEQLKFLWTELAVESPSRRLQALDAMRHVAEPSTVLKACEQALSDPDDRVRELSLHAIEDLLRDDKLSPEAVSQILQQVLDPSVREAALKALAKMRPQ